MAEAGTLYRHYKGGLYRLVAWATNEADLMDVVVYRSELDGRVWVRPRVDFYGNVHDEVCANAETVLRFTRVNDG